MEFIPERLAFYENMGMCFLSYVKSEGRAVRVRVRGTGMVKDGLKEIQLKCVIVYYPTVLSSDRKDPVKT